MRGLVKVNFKKVHKVFDPQVVIHLQQVFVEFIMPICQKVTQ